VTAGSKAGGYDRWSDAQQKMTTIKDRRFTPDPGAQAVYDELYVIYRELHDTFGGVPAARADLASVMKRLLTIRDR
jgi:L-ribulokinase